MRLAFVLALILGASSVKAQSRISVIEEKSSEWISVSATPVSETPSAPAVPVRAPKKKTPVKKEEVPSQPAFDKTNNKIKRFKKN